MKGRSQWDPHCWLLTGHMLLHVITGGFVTAAELSPLSPHVSLYLIEPCLQSVPVDCAVTHSVRHCGAHLKMDCHEILQAILVQRGWCLLSVPRLFLFYLTTFGLIAMTCSTFLHSKSWIVKPESSRRRFFFLHLAFRFTCIKSSRTTRITNT